MSNNEKSSFLLPIVDGSFQSVTNSLECRVILDFSLTHHNHAEPDSSSLQWLHSRCRCQHLYILAALFQNISTWELKKMAKKTLQASDIWTSWLLSVCMLVSLLASFWPAEFDKTLVCSFLGFFCVKFNKWFGSYFPLIPATVPLEQRVKKKLISRR